MIPFGAKIIGTIFATYGELNVHLGRPQDGPDALIDDGATCVWVLDHPSGEVAIYDRGSRVFDYHKATDQRAQHWSIMTTCRDVDAVAVFIEERTGRPVDKA